MGRAKDDVPRRSSARRDPRAEPESTPPPPEIVDEVVADRRRDPRAEPMSVRGARLAERAEREATDGEERDGVEATAEPAFLERARAEEAKEAKEAEEAEEVEVAEEERTALPSAGVPAGPDPRLAELDPLFARNAWADIVARLGPAEKASELPPPLALIHALAQREAAGDGGAPGATALAIASMAALLGVPAGSDTALVLAKRLLRQNPPGWRSRPAPRARVSAAIILLGIAVGAAVGWFVGLGSLRVSFGAFKLF